MSDAVKGGLIGDNPITKANSITGVVGRQRFLDLEEILKLLTASEEVADWLNRHFPDNPQFVANSSHTPPPMEEISLCGHPTALI